MEIDLTVITYLHPFEKHLNRCISGLKQQKIPFKWIILGKKDPNIKDIAYKFINLPDNCLNKSAAYNFILPQINSKYIAYNDADDISYKNRFSKQINYLEKNPKVDILGTSLTVNNGRKAWFIWQDDQDIKAYLGINNPMVNSSIMLRNKIDFWGKEASYKENLNRAEDYDFWLTCAKHKLIFANIREALVDYLQRQIANNDEEIIIARTIRESALKWLDIPIQQKGFMINYHDFTEKNASAKQVKLVINSELINHKNLKKVIKKHYQLYYQKNFIPLLRKFLPL